jgi:5'-methylthioadenosine phosphorylase
VFRVFAENIGRLRDVLMKVIADLPDDRACPCPHALHGIKLPFELP